MPDYRKPSQNSGGRADGGNFPLDGEFSIETTTMRLKSLKVRRAEAADKALDDHLRAGAPRTDERLRGDPPATGGPAGRVRHDERGMAVWDWAAAHGDTAALSATNVMRKLDVTGLSIEQTQRSLKAMEIEPQMRDAGGGGDPYNQRAASPGDSSGKGAAAGDPYNRGGLNTVTSRRPPPGADKRAGSWVLDQLTGQKKRP